MRRARAAAALVLAAGLPGEGRAQDVILRVTPCSAAGFPVSLPDFPGGLRSSAVSIAETRASDEGRAA